MKNKLFNYVKHLSEDIGPRLTASDGERLASNFIVNNLKSFGYSPIIEKFKTPKSPYEVFQFSYLTAFLISILFLKFNFYIKIFLLLVELFLLYFFYFEFTFKHTPIFSLFKRYYSKNIFVKIPGKNNTEERLIITAHIDSATASILFLPKIVKYLDKQLRFSFLSLIFLLVFSLLSFYFNSILLYILNYSLAVIFIVGFVITFHSEYIAKPTNGANDNASSVAVLLGLAEYFSKNKHNYKELWLVFTGAEEAGCIGIYEFLKKHKNEFDDKTYFVALDCTGTGIPVLIKSEGMLKKYKSDEKLLQRFKKIADYKKLKVQVQDLPVGYTEMEVPINFGFKAMTIGAAPENPEEVPNWHQITDTIANINPETLTDIYQLLISTAQF